jgi:hypothetical protein
MILAGSMSPSLNSVADQSSPVRIFIAATADEWLPTRVLDFSVREATALPVDVRMIASFGRTIPMPRHRCNSPRTPFSFQRFLIPELCSYHGRAIYLDADMQVFADIADLWGHPMQAHDLLTVSYASHGRQAQFSVMLLDCERLQWRMEDIVQGLDAGSFSYEQLLHGMCVARSVGRTISPTWNSLERYEAQVTRLLHYTDMNRQPWVATTNPLAHLWVACLRRAMASGFISRAELLREVETGHVRPSLIAQIDAGVDNPAELLVNMRQLDREFVAPYRRLTGQGWRRWSVRGLLRRL